jgi:hypothetical protein
LARIGSNGVESFFDEACTELVDTAESTRGMASRDSDIYGCTIAPLGDVTEKLSAAVSSMLSLRTD